MRREINDFLYNKNKVYIEYTHSPELIPTFDPISLIIDPKKGLDCSVAIFGARRTGKTFLLKEWLFFLNSMGVIGKIAVITSTTEQWEKLIPPEYVFDISNEHIDIQESLKKLISMQKKNKELYKKGKLPHNEPLQLTLILDDFSFDRKLSIYGEALSQVFQTGRHDKIAVFALIQNPTGVGNWIRHNADFAVMFKTRGTKGKERLHFEHFDFVDKNVFFQLSEEATMDRNVLISVKTDPYNDNQLFTYRATINVDDIENIGFLGDKRWLQKSSTKRREEYEKRKKVDSIDSRLFTEYFQKYKNIEILLK